MLSYAVLTTFLASSVVVARPTVSSRDIDPPAWAWWDLGCTPAGAIQPAGVADIVDSVNSWFASALDSAAATNCSAVTFEEHKSWCNTSSEAETACEFDAAFGLWQPAGACWFLKPVCLCLKAHRPQARQRDSMPGTASRLTSCTRRFWTTARRWAIATAVVECECLENIAFVIPD